MSETKYIINNSPSVQSIIGGLSVDGKLVFSTTSPNYPIGASGDKTGQVAIDNNYLYYCTADFSPSSPGSFIVSGGSPTHIFNEWGAAGWNSYYNPPSENYLQTGFVDSGDELFAPQNGWYIVDDIGNIRQIIGGSWMSPGAPVQNGAGWLMTLDGNFTLNEANTSLTFYESLPTVTFDPGITGSGDIWRSVKLDEELNTTATYRALLTHTGPIIGTSILDFQFALIPGETYTITNYISDDDFSNIANVTSGTINTTGCIFIATGEIPLIWDQGSELQSSGNLLVQVLENELGYDIEWTNFFAPGTYLGFRVYPGGIGLFNDFPRNQVFSTITQSNLILNGPPSGPITQFIGSNTFNVKDDCILIYNFNYDSYSAQDYWLYYTPVEIKTKINLDTTPVTIIGSIDASFPFNNVSFNLIDDNFIYVDSIYTGVGTTVNDMAELVDLLNSNENTNYFGIYEDDGIGGITLKMPSNIKQQFSPTGTLTITIFQD